MRVFVPVGMEVPDTADVSANFKQQSKGLDITDAFSKIGQIESGNDLDVSGRMRQETFEYTFLDEWADDPYLTAILENSRRQFLVPSCFDQPDRSLARHAALSK